MLFVYCNCRVPSNVRETFYKEIKELTGVDCVVFDERVSRAQIVSVEEDKKMLFVYSRMDDDGRDTLRKEIKEQTGMDSVIFGDFVEYVEVVPIEETAPPCGNTEETEKEEGQSRFCTVDAQIVLKADTTEVDRAIKRVRKLSKSVDKLNSKFSGYFVRDVQYVPIEKTAPPCWNTEER